MWLGIPVTWLYFLVLPNSGNLRSQLSSCPHFHLILWSHHFVTDTYNFWRYFLHFIWQTNTKNKYKSKEVWIQPSNISSYGWIISLYPWLNALVHILLFGWFDVNLVSWVKLHQSSGFKNMYKDHYLSNKGWTLKVLRL